MASYRADSVSIVVDRFGFFYRLWLAVLFVTTGEFHIYRPHRIRIHGPIAVSDGGGEEAAPSAVPGPPKETK